MPKLPLPKGFEAEVVKGAVDRSLEGGTSQGTSELQDHQKMWEEDSKNNCAPPQESV